MDLAGVRQWVTGHKWLAGGIGAGTLGGGWLLLRHGKAGTAAAAAARPAKLTVGRASAARVNVALHQVEQHHHRQPHRQHHGHRQHRKKMHH